MIYKVKRKLTLTERKQIKKIKDNKTESGIILTDLINIKGYNGLLVIPHKYEELKPYISILDLEANKDFKFDVLDNVLGNYELRVNEDIINLELY